MLLKNSYLKWTSVDDKLTDEENKMDEYSFEDHVMMCELFGKMKNFPKHIKMIVMCHQFVEIKRCEIDSIYREFIEDYTFEDHRFLYIDILKKGKGMTTVERLADMYREYVKIVENQKYYK